jgi:hypothetical protein
MQVDIPARMVSRRTKATEHKMRRASNVREGLQVALLHGPTRTPVGDGAPCRPFHGIVGLGLLEILPPGGACEWEVAAPLLDAALSGDAASTERLPAGLLTAARERGVLSFAQSAAAAVCFAAQHVDAASCIELWNVKEGHTSSVWRLSADGPDGVRTRLALNIARDDVAGAELERSADVLDDLARRTSVPVAAVVACARVALPGDGAPCPHVVAQEWVDDAVEVGFLRDRSEGVRRLYAIERFVTSGEVPGRITGAVGRRLTDDEHIEVARCATRVALDGADVDADGLSISFPRLDLNHGDWVWTPDGPHAVAAAGKRVTVRADRAAAHLLSVWVNRYGIEDEHGRELLARGTDAALCEEFDDAGTSALIVAGRRS